jgi:hypothetical protein
MDVDVLQLRKTAVPLLLPKFFRADAVPEQVRRPSVLLRLIGAAVMLQHAHGTGGWAARSVRGNALARHNTKLLAGMSCCDSQSKSWVPSWVLPCDEI